MVAQTREGIQRLSDLASALNESQQTVKNWQDRGISKDGALKAQARFKCDANWLLIEGPASKLPAHEVREPPPMYFSGDSPSLWPFPNIKSVEFALLSNEERDHIERDIILRIKGRQPNQSQPENDAITRTRATRSA